MAVRFFKLLVIKCLFHGRSEENVSRSSELLSFSRFPEVALIVYRIKFVLFIAQF